MTGPVAPASFSLVKPLLPRRFDAPANVVLLGALYAAYSAVRSLTGDTGPVAHTNAARLLQFQSAFGFDVEQTVQSAFGAPMVFIAANIYYLLHFPLTLIVLALTFWHRRLDIFPIVRNSLIGSTTAALVVHMVVPMAPPRMLSGFVDATTVYGPDPYSIPGSGAVNEFASMPSMHVGWAILTGYATWNLSNRWLIKAVAFLHPALTALVVIVTGHHFVSDAVVGAGLAITFLILSTSLIRTFTARRNGTSGRLAAGVSRFDSSLPYRSSPFEKGSAACDRRYRKRAGRSTTG